MSHQGMAASFLLASVLSVALTGCGEDPKQRIALLESDNQRLLDELGRLRGEADSAQRGREMCEQHLADMRSSNATLASRISDLESTQPQVPQGWTAVPGGAMIAIPGEVLFPSGKAALRPGARKLLGRVVSAINEQYGTHEVLVYGHTDNVPIKKSGWKDNFELSAQRALSVVRDLQTTGINPKRLVACGCGEHRPVAPNSSDASRSRNRRVEIYALDPAVKTAGR